MNHTEIKIELLKNGTTQAKIASDLGCSRQLVNAVIQNNNSNRSVRVEVAKNIKQPLLKVFPDEAYREPFGRILKERKAKG